MLYDSLLASHIMYFDDDSHLTTRDSNWWREVHELAESCTMLGQIWKIPQRKQQYLAIREQPWYTGQPVDAKHWFRFATGGWWVADRRFLWKWNYPFPEIYHNGGDSILGELVRQQQGNLVKFHRGVLVNVGGRESRRGIGVAEEVYVWQNYVLGQDVSLSHHDFPCRVHTYHP
jgi:hypothetical protein